MKKPLFILLAAFIVMLGCSNPAGGNKPASKPSDISQVSAVAAGSLAASGAGTGITIMKSPSDFVKVLGGMGADDLVAADLASVFSADAAMYGAASSSARMAAFVRSIRVHPRDIGSLLQSQLGKIQSDISNFPTTKSLNEKIDLSGEALGQYFTLGTAKAAIGLTAVTTDGGAIDESWLNVKSIGGQGTVSLVLDPSKTLASAGSVVKDLRVRLNAGGTMNVTTTASDGYQRPDKLILDYADSLAISLSLYDPGTNLGGKVVLTQYEKYAGTIDIASLESSPGSLDAGTLMPSVTITVTVYDDNNVKQWAREYSGASAIDDFMNEFTAG